LLITILVRIFKTTFLNGGTKRDQEESSQVIGLGRTAVKNQLLFAPCQQWLDLVGNNRLLIPHYPINL
jgi:hypothetical protein